jgi:glycosyltransferase involved in cell wall biosynthesis
MSISSCLSPTASPAQHRARSWKDRQIRVLFVISNLEYGGAQRQVVELANNFDRSRVDAHICSLSDYVPLARELKTGSDRLHIIRKRARFDLLVVPRLARLIRRLKVDVVHGYLFDAEVAARLAGHFAGVQLVAGSERNTNYTLKRVQRAAYRITRRLPHLIVANSISGASFHANLLGHDQSIYRVVYNGVDTTRFAPRNRDESRREFGLGVGDRIVGMFASFKRQKNHPMLFAAAERLVQRVPHVRLLLVGDQLAGGLHGSSEYKRRMESLLDSTRLRPHCISLGNRDDVDRIYPACDVTVLPSLFEGTPNAALESMACGVPVVATDVADNAFVIPDGKVGFIVPLDAPGVLAERLERILLDSSLGSALGRTARAWVVDEFSIRQLAARTEGVYREWLAKSA